MKYLYKYNKIGLYINSPFTKYGLRLLTVCFHADVSPDQRYFCTRPSRA